MCPSKALLWSSFILLSACMQKSPNPDDPYEALNRKTHAFNMAFDATFLKPPAQFYKAAVPDPVRASINNAYENINMIPTIANDLLQGRGDAAVHDTQRFLINSTLGVAGFFDVADKHFQLPRSSNDLGLTFAKWGDRHSPYLVIPFLGPSTIRDGMGMLFEYVCLTPYPYIPSGAAIDGILLFRYVDLRSQYLESEKLMREAIDPYAFLRDAYLQHRQYKMNEVMGTPVAVAANEPDAGSDYVDE